MSTFTGKVHRIIQRLAQGQITNSNRLYIGTLVTEPILKPRKGPDAVLPYDPGDDRDTDPDSVLGWFCDVRLDAGKNLLRDAIVPTQARSNIGQVGSPVTVYSDPTTGAYMVVGRADRVTSVQSVKSYDTDELDVGFVKGNRTLAGGDVISAFYPYTHAASAILTSRIGGIANAGLNRGVQGFDTSGNPVTSFSAGVTVAPVPFLQLAWGTDPFGVSYETTRNPDGTTTTVKRNP